MSKEEKSDRCQPFRRVSGTHLVSPFSCCCWVVEQKNKSSKFTFCIRTTHNWFNRITKRFSTSVGYLTPKLVVNILSNGRKNDSCTNNSWWREFVTNCSYNFNCSNRTAFAYLTSDGAKGNKLEYFHFLRSQDSWGLRSHTEKRCWRFRFFCV